jgi:hypothetical protein
METVKIVRDLPSIEEKLRNEYRQDYNGMESIAAE